MEQEKQEDTSYMDFIDWYMETFDSGKKPSFADYLKAHVITEKKSFPTAQLRDKENQPTFDVWEHENTSFAFTIAEDQPTSESQVWCVSTYLWDNPKWEGEPVAYADTFLFYCPSGDEKEVFEAIDYAAETMLPLLAFYPATTCRAFALGMIGLTHLDCLSSVTPAYKTMLNQIINERILPGLNAHPYIMLYDSIAPGYNFSIDEMISDIDLIPVQDEVKAISLVEQRIADQNGHISWQMAKLKATPIGELELCMHILDKDVYCEEILFHIDETNGTYTNSIVEPREEPLTYEDYAEGNFEPVGVPQQSTSEEEN